MQKPTNQHTPGPWRFHDQGEANEWCLLANQNRWVAAFRQNGNMWNAEQLANARLMAAAPELLEALKNMVGMTEFLGLENDPHFGQKVRVTIGAAREAIAKATPPPTN